MSTRESLARLLTEPTPETLWQLRRDLLQSNVTGDSLRILGEFYLFLNELAANSTSRQYSHFASLLDLGAIGGVAIQNLLEMESSGDWSRRLLAGGLSEALMVLAARQYVKAWDEEMNSTYNSAAWYLYEEFWRLSADLQPEMPAQARSQLVDKLVAPLRDRELQGIVKAAIIVHFFQLLLVARLEMLLGANSGDGSRPVANT